MTQVENPQNCFVKTLEIGVLALLVYQVFGLDKCRLKKITIPLPDLKSQKIIADKYYAKINEIKELKYKLEKATAELEHIYTEEK